MDILFDVNIVLDICTQRKLSVAEAVARRGFSLPMGPDLSEDVQAKVVATIASQLF